MRSAHVKDGVALCVFFARISVNITSGDTSWTELRAAADLDTLRWQQPLSRGPSFETIAAVGVNAALPHYEPSNATDRPVTDHELFLVDSGGQYLGNIINLLFEQSKTEYASGAMILCSVSARKLLDTSEI